MTRLFTRITRRAALVFCIALAGCAQPISSTINAADWEWYEITRDSIWLHTDGKSTELALGAALGGALDGGDVSPEKTIVIFTSTDLAVLDASGAPAFVRNDLSPVAARWNNAGDAIAVVSLRSPAHHPEGELHILDGALQDQRMFRLRFSSADFDYFYPRFELSWSPDDSAIVVSTDQRIYAAAAMAIFIDPVRGEQFRSEVANALFVDVNLIAATGGQGRRIREDDSLEVVGQPVVGLYRVEPQSVSLVNLVPDAEFALASSPRGRAFVVEQRDRRFVRQGPSNLFRVWTTSGETTPLLELEDDGRFHSRGGHALLPHR